MSKKILAAEDDAALYALLEDLLTDEGYDVTIVDDGLKAKQQLAEQRYDLILLDYMMPGMTGIEVCHWIRNADNFNSAAPVILLTAKAQDKEMELAGRVQVTSYMIKPFSPMELLKQIDQLLNQ